MLRHRNKDGFLILIISLPKHVIRSDGYAEKREPKLWASILIDSADLTTRSASSNVSDLLKKHIQQIVRKCHLESSPDITDPLHFARNYRLRFWERYK